MSEEAELIAKVLADPDDDGPRMVIADFWQSKGDPRGEFVTLQLRLAAAKDDDARRKIRIAENKLLAAHGAEWSKALLAAAPASSPLRANKIAFHRGFLEEAAFPLSALDDLEPYFVAAPTLRQLRFDAPQFGAAPLPPPSLTGKLDSPRLKGVRSLDLRVAAGGDLVALAIAESSQLTGLRELKLQASSWPVPGYTFFTGDPATHLLTSVGAAALARAPSLAGLTQLELTPNAIDSAGVKAIAGSAWKLEHLDLSGNKLDDAALTALADGAIARTLKSLVIGGGAFTPKGLETLAKSKALGELQSLKFDGSQLGAKGLSAFLSALKLPKLTSLGLAMTALADEGAKVIAGAKSIGQFKSLELQDNKITQAGVAALAESKLLGGLERLLLNDAWLGKKANLEQLAASTALANCRIYVKGTLISGKAKKEAKAKPPKAEKKAAAKKKGRT
ncbi:MAG: TIGR02996 domain-containing protein [Archangium sp.]